GHQRQRCNSRPEGQELGLSPSVLHYPDGLVRVEGFLTLESVLIEDPFIDFHAKSGSGRNHGMTSGDLRAVPDKPALPLGKDVVEGLLNQEVGNRSVHLQRDRILYGAKRVMERHFDPVRLGYRRYLLRLSDSPNIGDVSLEEVGEVVRADVRCLFLGQYPFSKRHSRPSRGPVLSQTLNVVGMDRLLHEQWVEGLELLGSHYRRVRVEPAMMLYQQVDLPLGRIFHCLDP